MAELPISIDFKRWNLGFYCCKDQQLACAIDIKWSLELQIHRGHLLVLCNSSTTATLDQVGRAGSLNRLQEVEPGVSQAARTSNWLASSTLSDCISGPGWQSCQSQSSSRTGTWGLTSCKDQQLACSHHQAKPGASASISTSRSGTWGFTAARTRCGSLSHCQGVEPGVSQVALIAPLDQFGRAASLNQLQGVEPGVPQLQDRVWFPATLPKSGASCPVFH